MFVNFPEHFESLPSIIGSMALEDFFSPTEMKNGLTTPARVEELILLMQNQKDYTTGNAGDAARQWLIVANTLASTKDEECLNHLLQLNLLFFLNQWLQEALSCSHGAAVSEELINAIFKSLEKLPLCKEKLITSGILVTVKKLIGHKLWNIKERAQTFFEKWADERVNDEAEKGGSDLVDNSKTSPDEASIDLYKIFDCSPTLTAVDEGGFRLQLGYNENIVDDGLKGCIPYQSVPARTLKEFKPGQNAGKGLEDLSSNGSLLREAGDFTSEFNNLGNELSLKSCKEVDVLTVGDLYKTSNDNVTEAASDNQSHLAFESEEVVDYKDQSCNSFPEVISIDFFSSESCDFVENNRPNVVSEDLDCELSLIPFNPVNLLSPPLMVSGSNGAPGLPIIPLHLECELGLRSSAATDALDGENMMSDSKQEGKFSEIDLNLEMGPLLVKELHVPYGIPSIYPSSELSSKRAKTIQLGLNCVKEEEEEEEDPSFLQLSSSTQPSMRNLDLNDDSFVFDSDPFYSTLDSRMIIDRRDELSTRTFMTGIEESTPSSSNWAPDLDLSSGIVQIENGSGEQGTLMQLFMPERRNLLGEERKTLKRKEPDSGWDPYGFGYNQLKLKL